MGQELPELEELQDLREMLGHHKIRKTLSTYCHGCDRCDEPRMASIYTEDGWDNHGAISASGADFARDMTATIVATNHSMSHLLGQSQINVEGDKVGAGTYFITRASGRNCLYILVPKAGTNPGGLSLKLNTCAKAATRVLS